MDTPLLWHIPLSHYSEKARWALDYKRIAHHRQVLGPKYLIRAWRATGATRNLLIKSMHNFHGASYEPGVREFRISPDAPANQILCGGEFGQSLNIVAACCASADMRPEAVT